METLIILLSILLVFLCGVWLIAIVIKDTHGDTSASYPLFAVRDRLIGVVVFKGVPRDDPYFEAIYEHVCSILIHSNLLSGPDRWRLAEKVGEYFASHPDKGKVIRRWPDEGTPPAHLKPVMEELCHALDYLLKNHVGFVFQMHASLRQQRRLQRKKAQTLKEMVRNTPSFSAC